MNTISNIRNAMNAENNVAFEVMIDGSVKRAYTTEQVKSICNTPHYNLIRNWVVAGKIVTLGEISLAPNSKQMRIIFSADSVDEFVSSQRKTNVITRGTSQYGARMTYEQAEAIQAMLDERFGSDAPKLQNLSAERTEKHREYKLRTQQEA